MFLEETHAVLALRKLYHWTSGQKPQLTKKGKRIDCNVSNYEFLYNANTYFIIIFMTGFRFDESRFTENPIPERSGGTGEELRGNLQHKQTETENKNKNERSEEVQSDPVHDLPDWLQEFGKNLVDESGPLEPPGDPAPGHRDTAISSHDAECVYALSEGTKL